MLNHAVFTIVKNENYFLTKWINHYKKFYPNSNIYVLDHQSNDGSTNNLNVNVIKINYELAFDHQWLCNTVQKFQNYLLTKYKTVLFAEADELVYSKKINFCDFLHNFENSNFNYLTCFGFEIIQNLQKEKPLNFNESIIKNRNYWFENPWYHKTLLSKIPLLWNWGFHSVKNLKPLLHDDLFLCHLHRCDFELMLKRHQERSKWNLKDDGNSGFQHKIFLKEELLNYFNFKAKYQNGFPSPIVEIPLDHKNILLDI